MTFLDRPENNVGPIPTIEQLEASVKRCLELREEYYAAKKASDEAHRKLRVMEEETALAIERTGKTKYVSEVGSLSFSDVETFRTPKTVEDKMKMFSWWVNNLGQEALDAAIGINYQTLNSVANRHMAEHDLLSLDIPGVEKGTTRKVSLTKKRS